MIIAPPGRYKPAQGNALGRWISLKLKALKGRDNQPSISRVVAPFQGSTLLFMHVPRALPWAGLSGPVRAEHAIASATQLTVT